jgi:hypothetical protein
MNDHEWGIPFLTNHSHDTHRLVNPGSFSDVGLRMGRFRATEHGRLLEHDVPQLVIDVFQKLDHRNINNKIIGS